MRRHPSITLLGDDTSTGLLSPWDQERADELNCLSEPLFEVRNDFNWLKSAPSQWDGRFVFIDHGEVPSAAWLDKGDVLIHINRYGAMTAPSSVDTGVFYDLLERWREETCFSSDLDEIQHNMAYLEIIGLGEPVLPLIFAEMQKEPDHWFLALEAITRQDPVPQDHWGDLPAMTQDWLDWARKNGF